MDALPPSLPNTGLPQPVPAATAGLAILLAELSQALAKLPPNSVIPAVVTQILAQADPNAAAKPPGTLVQISTPDGPAQVRVPLPVAVGATLEIAVAADGPQPQWRLLTVNDRPVTPATIAVTTPPPAPAISSSAASSSATSAAWVDATPRPTPAPGIPATLVRSADPALPNGTTLLVRIAGLVPPPLPPAVSPAAPPATAVPDTEPAATEQVEISPQPVPAQTAVEAVPAPETEQVPPAANPPPPPPVQTAQPESASASVPAPIPLPAAAPAPAAAAPTPPVTPPTASAPAPAPAPTLAPALAPAPVPGPTPVPVSAPAQALPPAPAPAPAATPQIFTPQAATSSPAPSPAPSLPPVPAQIEGEVLPNTDTGRTLVRTPIGLLALDVEPQSAPPAGAQVTLSVIGKPAPPAALPPPVAAPDDPPDKALPRRLSELLDQVQQRAGGDRLADAVRQAIPAPGPKLAAQLLSAISASNPAQGLPRLLGESVAAALSHAAPQAMEALSRQWEAISLAVHGPDEGEWRTLLIPLMIPGAQASLLRLTTRNRRRGASGAEREKGTRFLLDFDLSRLGPMQFDGLVKRQHKHFDLIIRTRDPLPGEMRRDIDGLFLTGLMNFGLQGSISFQPDGRFVALQPLTRDANGIIFA